MMKKSFYLLLSIITAALAISAFCYAQQQGFTTINGNNLSGKFAEARERGRTGQTDYLVAYQFDPKPGVMIDDEYDHRYTNKQHSNDEQHTTNVGIFFHFDQQGKMIKAQLYNLDRKRDYQYPVYWLGHANNGESLTLLDQIVRGKETTKICEGVISAIALHNDQRVGGILEAYLNNGQQFNEQLLKQAIFWLGQVDGETPFLGTLLANQNEPQELRKQAAFAIGVSKDSQALDTLSSLFQNEKNIEVKKQIIFGIFVNDDKQRGADLLINIADHDRETETRKQAIFWLGQMAGQRSLDTLGRVVEGNDENTEVQKQAVFAISQRQKDEAVPLLIKIARTHANPEVRKQAIFWLGQIDDARALELFREILKK